MNNLCLLFLKFTTLYITYLTNRNLIVEQHMIRTESMRTTGTQNFFTVKTLISILVTFKCTSLNLSVIQHLKLKLHLQLLLLFIENNLCINNLRTLFFA